MLGTHAFSPQLVNSAHVYSVSMAPMSGKRSLDSMSQKPRKRQRAGSIERLPGKLKGPKETTTLDALPWNEVSLPGRFDDAEGFFGLEEISDVEVVKGTKTGKLEYRVSE
jgi:ATP-dependent RNA helicase DDX24/MAK5